MIKKPSVLTEQQFSFYFRMHTLGLFKHLLENIACVVNKPALSPAVPCHFYNSNSQLVVKGKVFYTRGSFNLDAAHAKQEPYMIKALEVILAEICPNTKVCS